MGTGESSFLLRTVAVRAAVVLMISGVEQNPGLVDQYLSTLLALEPSSATNLVLLGVCLDFCNAHKDRATIEKHKVSPLEVVCFQVVRILRKQRKTLCRVVSQSALLDLYIKSVLMSKTKPQQHVLDKSASLLRHASHSDFKELLLPSMQKTMLRSPENAIRSETAATMSHEDTL